MKQTDPRINVRRFNLRNYVFLFVIILFFAGSYAGVYFLQWHKSRDLYIVLSMLAYLVVISGFATFLFALLRMKNVEKPINIFQNAFKQVAQGDYSVRLEKMRTDGKVDEFEVMVEDFNFMVNELESVEMLKNDFVSNVSHELKTPITIIQNTATLIASGELSDDERKEYCEKLSQTTNRLSYVIDNILQLSRLENSKVKPELRQVNLSESISESILLYDSILDERNLDVEIDLDSSIIVETDPQLLSIVWKNILTNAIKFTPEKGKIGITLKADEKNVMVSFSDTGCGMDEHTVRHIFEKFYQGDTSHATKGNGLGLALVMRIIDLLQGEIIVDSELGKGSTFTIKLKK